jgi:hypothetical protein
MPQECPRCRLLSPPEALLCDCGYDFQTGTLGLTAEAKGLSTLDRERVAGIADSYRALVGLVWLQVVAIIGNAVVRLVIRHAAPDVRSMILTSAAGAVLLASALAGRAAYRVMTQMGLPASTRWSGAIVFFGPFALLTLNVTTRDWFQRYGIAVGPLGPRAQDIDRLGRMS